MSRVTVTVLVDEPYRQDILEVVAALQSAGMTVEQWMDKIGVITGSIDSTQVTTIAQVAGVAAVEESQTYRLDPPDSNLQ